MPIGVGYRSKKLRQISCFLYKFNSLSQTKITMKTLKIVSAFIFGFLPIGLSLSPITDRNTSSFSGNLINADTKVLENRDRLIPVTQKNETMINFLFYGISIFIFGAVFVIYVFEYRDYPQFDRCPKCKKLKLQRTYLVLPPSSDNRERRQRILCQCHNCSYYQESEEIMPQV
jgi:hypothetical protein